MKANEAPEKIFLSRNALGVLCDSWWLEPDKSLDNVEYVRKDAFIEKACEYWYQYNQDIVKGHSEKHILGRGEFAVNVEDFKRYLKGE